MEGGKATATWDLIARVLVKTAILFALCNVLFAAAQPLEALGRMSLYNRVLPGRLRLPYGENPSQSYNLSLYNVPAMFASHVLVRPKADDEFRVLLLGDSGVWGWLLRNEETLAEQLNAAEHTVEGRRVVIYNLGYPVMSLTKDVMLLDEALRYEPDIVVWLVTLASFPREKQLFPPLVQHNPQRVRALIREYNLGLDPADSRFIVPEFWENTIIGQRRNLADLLRLQTYGFAWAATGIDQAIPAEFPLRQSDFEADLTWEDFTEPTPLTRDDLALEVLEAGVAMAADVPVLIVNEPIYISEGRNSDLRYNSFYPRWAYDTYRELLAVTADERGWLYLDTWDHVAAEEFTDTPVHLTAEGTAQLSREIGEMMVSVASAGT